MDGYHLRVICIDDTLSSLTANTAVLSGISCGATKPVLAADPAQKKRLGDNIYKYNKLINGHHPHLNISRLIYWEPSP
jgi:hypothetical protein